MRISSKTVRMNKESLTTSIQNLYFPGFDEMKTIVEDFAIMALRRKDHWYSFITLQINLMTAMITEIQTLKSIKEMRDTNEEKEFLDFYESATRTTLNALIQVADGIAYRFIDYNYSLYTMLQANKSSVYALLEEGFSEGLELAAILNDRKGPGSQVLITDLNSVTNIGDIIVKTDDSFEIIEVKKGNSRGARISRQKERMKSLVDFHNNEYGQVNEKPVNMLKLPSRRHELKVLEEMLIETETEGTAIREINEFLCVCCVDAENLSKSQKSNEINILLGTLKEWEGEELTITISSLDYRQNTGTTVPFTVYPIETRLVVDLLMGSKFFISSLKIDKLEQYISSQGWDVINIIKEGVSIEVVKENNYPIFILLDKDDPSKNATFPVDFLLSIMMELIDVQNYLDMAKVSTSYGDTHHWIPFYEDEKNLWK
ncbi:hypothetical protein [Paenibacillus sp. FSL H8-457]|uniref:hypothetical protein n=2 Tax=unclassified Paenibacillus TaxID=185978 RepID=UPI0003E21A27|nr:hypothetical protein [Paenibacillus sp. FSL H8-457]ETT67659.1 hypothetical protein C172_05889 [Paenibacillus sp. FSL H8-457]